VRNNVEIKKVVVGLADDDLGIGPLFPEDSGDPLEGATGAETRHPVVEPLGASLLILTTDVLPIAPRMLSYLAIISPQCFSGENNVFDT
jgi:hypothetical protein